MATSNEIADGANAIAEDLCLPGGGLKKLARVIEGHLDWFDMVEARGLTWADISRLLFSAGAKGRNGRPFSVGTLYSTVWRKREDAKRIGRGIASSSKSTTGVQSSPQESPPRKGRLGSAPIRSGSVEPLREQVRRSSGLKPERRSKILETKQVKASKERSFAEQSVRILTKPPSNKDLLAFMQRSAAVRGFKSGK